MAEEIDVRQPLSVQALQQPSEPRPGIALCLSGGGYRAMVFHAGVLCRLNEAGYLKRLARVSSVSGGSIAAGVLACGWSDLAFDAAGVATNFVSKVVDPIRRLAGKTIDAKSILKGFFWKGSAAEHAAAALRKHLYGDATLADLPDSPRFVFNATNVQTGSLWRFSKPYMADYKLGQVMNPKVQVATAVAASAAFPPVLSPVVLHLDPKEFVDPNSKAVIRDDAFKSKVVLSDGGVYDNLGLETAWKAYDTILVSNGGAPFKFDSDPSHIWPQHAIRVLDLIDSQVRALRKRQVMGGYHRKDRKGAYWGIESDIANFPATNKLPCPVARTAELARVPTRLAEMDGTTQERLMNWGYAVCDAAIRSHLPDAAASQPRFPYPATGV